MAAEVPKVVGIDSEFEENKKKIHNEVVAIINECYPRLAKNVRANSFSHTMIRCCLIVLFSIQVSAFGASIDRCVVITLMVCPVVFLPTVAFEEDKDDPALFILPIVIQTLFWIIGAVFSRAIDLNANNFGLISSAILLMFHALMTRPLNINNWRISEFSEKVEKFIVKSKEPTEEYAWSYSMLITIPENINSIDKCIQYMEETRTKNPSRVRYPFFYNLNVSLKDIPAIIEKAKVVHKDQITAIFTNGVQICIKWHS